MWPQNWCITSRRNGKVWWFKQTKIPALTSKYTKGQNRQQTKTRHLLLPPPTPPPPSSLQGNLDSVQIRRERRVSVTSQHVHPGALAMSTLLTLMRRIDEAKPTLPMGCSKQQANTGWCWFSLTTLSNDFAGLRGGTSVLHGLLHYYRGSKMLWLNTHSTTPPVYTSSQMPGPIHVLLNHFNSSNLDTTPLL